MTRIDWALESCELLRRDPRVSDAVKAPHVAGLRDSLLVAANPIWVASELRAAGETMRRTLRSWEAAYDIAYRKSDATPGPNFAGWNDSFTGEPIPLTEMSEWLRAITARVLSLPHDSVVEIGCGTGLIVQAVAPHCRLYEATDFSNVAVTGLQAWLATQPNLNHVKSFCQAAHEVDYSKEEVDLIIINSVAQHFPDAAYLDSVITAAWKRLRKGGHIVLGDIRLLGAQKTFTYAEAFAKAPNEMRADELRQSVQALWLSQTELLVNPAFFHRFAIKHGGTVRVQLKGGRGTCEMTRYRCDVTIGKPSRKVERLRPTLLRDVGAVHEWISGGKKGVAQICGLTNSRVTSDLLTRQLIERAADDVTVADLRTTVFKMITDVDPADHPAYFEELALRNGLSCEIVASLDAPDCRFDVLIGETDGCMVPSQTPDSLQYTNSPLLMGILRRLSVDLHKSIAGRTPAGEMPTRILVDENIDDLQLVFKQL